jgi:pantothenate kinase
MTVIIWINGTHGVGKSTTNLLVQELVPDAQASRITANTTAATDFCS